jgi:FkbM family methyltransferase
MSSIDTIFSTLERDLTELTQKRTPSYLRETVGAGCFVYGAGSYGRRLAAIVAAHGLPCHGIIDRKFDGSIDSIDGIRAIHPTQLMKRETEGLALLIGVHNFLTNLPEIIAFGKDLSFSEILWNADLPDALGPQADNYWLTERRFVLDHFARFRQAAGLLADQASVGTFAALLRYRATGQQTDQPICDIDEQYLPKGLFHFGRPICLVDGGAYDGDTYRHLRTKNVEISDWIAFEPDPRNFISLAAFSRTENIQATLLPCGLGQTLHHIPFAGDEGTSSHLTAKGTGMTVACVALDDVIHGKRVDYIKLDIEGAEYDALRGMARTIETNQPHLAVSAYHRPEDLFAIPETITELAPGTKLHLRQHALNAFDTVIYAVPAR